MIKVKFVRELSVGGRRCGGARFDWDERRRVRRLDGPRGRVQVSGHLSPGAGGEHRPRRGGIGNDHLLRVRALVRLDERRRRVHSDGREALAVARLQRHLLGRLQRRLLQPVARHGTVDPRTGSRVPRSCAVPRRTDGSVASTTQVAVHWKASGQGDERHVRGAAGGPALHGLVRVRPTSRPATSRTTFVVGQVEHGQFAVFGAFLPNKEVLFDNDGGGAARQRVIEGGALVPGANVTLSFTDWRGDRLVNRDSLNTTIGQGQTESRFGVSNVEIQGQLTYNIAAVYSTDGGQTFTTVTLSAVSSPDALDNPSSYGRTAYQTTFPLPNGASDFKVAFHVQAILTASPQNSAYVNNWYQSPNGSTFVLGQQYVLADTWDNNGASDGNYDLPVGAAASE